MTDSSQWSLMAALIPLQRRARRGLAPAANSSTTTQSRKAASTITQEIKGMRPNTSSTPEVQHLPGSIAAKSEKMEVGTEDKPQPTKKIEKAVKKTSRIKREQSDIFKSFSKPVSKLSRENPGNSTVEAAPAVSKDPVRL